jgi:hypothetical protein
MIKFVPSNALATPQPDYPLHYEHLHFIPTYSTDAVNGKTQTNSFTQVPIANPTFSVEWLKESDRIATSLGVSRNNTENWSTYCRRILESNLSVYEELKTECGEALRTENEIKASTETLMKNMIDSGDFSTESIIKIKGLHEVLIPHIQKLRSLQPLLNSLGIDTTKIFNQMTSSVDVINGKINEKGLATDVTSATELFYLYVVKSCVGELTLKDKTQVRGLLTNFLIIDDKTINLFLRSTNSAENLVAIHSIETFVQQNIKGETILSVYGNFLKLKTVDSFETLIQMYVTIESYGSNDQKKLVREGGLDFKKIITRTIDANLEIQNLLVRDTSINDKITQHLEYSIIEKNAKQLFFISVKDCNNFFAYYIYSTSSLKESFHNSDLVKKRNTCVYILSPDYNVETFTSNEKVLEFFYPSPSIELLISSVKQQYGDTGFLFNRLVAKPNIVNPKSFPNLPTYWENAYSRGLELTLPRGEMKWTACNMTETIKSNQMASCTINEFKSNMLIASDMMSSFNEIVLNLDYDDRFPSLASKILSSVNIYVTKFNEFKEQNLEITANLKRDFDDIEYFAQSIIRFKYEHIQPNKLGMNLISSIIQNSKETTLDYSTFTIIQMEEFIRKSYTDETKTISFKLYSTLSNLMSITKIHQAIWEMEIKTTPLDDTSANDLNIQGLYKLTTIDLNENVQVETLLKLREGRTSIALSNQFFSKTQSAPTNSKVFDSLLSGTITNSTKEQVTKDYIGFLRNSGTGLILSKSSTVVIQEQTIFDKQFELLNITVVNSALNQLEWKSRVSFIFKLLNLCEKLKGENLVDFSQAQVLSIQKYEGYVLFEYEKELNGITSIDDLIKLKAEIFSLTNYGMFSVMSDIILLLHSKYMELSPENYQPSYKNAYEIVTSKFPSDTDNKKKIVISFYLALQETEHFDTIRNYIQTTEDSPLQIANRLFFISRKPLIGVPVVYVPIDSEEKFEELQHEDFSNNTPKLKLFNCFVRLLEFALNHNEILQLKLEAYVELVLETYIEENLNKENLTFYSEILTNPYVYNNPSIKDLCVRVLTVSLYKDKFPSEKKLVYLPQHYEDLAVVNLGGNSSTQSLLSLITELNIETFAKTPFDSWPKPQLRDDLFALSYDMNDVNDFFKGSYIASDVKSERFSDEPPSELVLFSNNNNTNINKPPPETPEVIPGNEITVRHNKETIKEILQTTFSGTMPLSQISQEKILNFLWMSNPNEVFVMEVLRFISYDPFFGKLSLTIQQVMIKKIKKTLVEWMEMIVVEKIDTREEVINLMLQRELIVGELGDVIIDLGLGFIFSIYRVEYPRYGGGKLTVNVPSFANAVQYFFEVYHHEIYGVDELFVYVRKCFLMYTSIPSLVWNSDVFFQSVFDANNVDGFFKKLMVESEVSASTDRVIITNMTGLSIADQAVRITRITAQTVNELRLKTLDYSLNTDCLKPIEFTLSFLLSKHSTALTSIEEKYSEVVQKSQLIGIQKIWVIKNMPVPPSKIFSIDPQLKLSRAKIDFVQGVQTLKTEIEITEGIISTEKINGIINSMVSELPFLSSDPSFRQINQNFIEFQSTFGPLLEKYNETVSEIQTGIAEADFVMGSDGISEESYNLSLLNKFMSLNQTLVQYRELHHKMNVELSRFTEVLKTGNITLGYSVLEQSTLTKMGELQTRGNLKFFELTLTNSAEIQKEFQQIGDTWKSVDCSAKITAIQDKLNDENYKLGPENKAAYQSQIDLMTPLQTKIKNNDALVTLQSEINTYITRFDYADTKKENSISYSLTDLRETQQSINTLFANFDGDKTEIGIYESKTKTTMQNTISLYESSIQSHETEVTKIMSAANSTLHDLNNEIKTDEQGYNGFGLINLYETKNKFDSDVLFIKGQKTSLNNLLGKIHELTGENPVRNIEISFDISSFERHSELLGTVIMKTETLNVSDMQFKTETAYTQVESFLTGVVTNMTSVPLTSETEEINYGNIYEVFNTLNVLFEVTATQELKSYNEMKYIKKNSSEIITRNQIKRKNLQSLLKDLEDDKVPAFNQRLGYYKKMTSLYDSAKTKKSELFSPGDNGVKPIINLINSGVLYSELNSIRYELLTIPGIVLEKTLTDDISEVSRVRRSLGIEKTNLKNDVTRIKSEIQKSVTLIATQTKTAEYLTTLDNLFAITGSDQYDETNMISGMTQTATSHLKSEKSRFDAQAIAEKRISEQQEEIVIFLTSVQTLIQNNNVTESVLNQFFPTMNTYSAFLSSDEKGEEWNSKVFVPLNASVSSGMSLLSKERSDTVTLFSQLNDFKVTRIEPTLQGDKIDDLAAAQNIYEEGKRRLSLCGNSTKSSNLKLTEETTQKETSELQSVTTLLDSLNSNINHQITINDSVNKINTTFTNFMFLETPTLVEINTAIDEVNSDLSYEPENSAFDQFKPRIAELNQRHVVITEEIQRVKQNVTATKETITIKQPEFNAAQQRGELESMQQIFGEMESAKKTFIHELDNFFNLTQTIIYDEGQDINSMRSIINQQSTDNAVAIKSLSDKVNDAAVIVTRQENAAVTADAETQVFSYYSSINNLIDNGEITDEDIRKFQENEILEPLLGRVKSAQNNETQFITDNKLTTEDGINDLLLESTESKFKLFNSLLTENKESVGVKVSSLIETDGKRTQQVNNLIAFVKGNIEPLFVENIVSLSKAVEFSKSAKELLNMIPQPVIKRVESLDSFNALTYSQMFVQLDTNIFKQSTENDRVILERSRETAIQESFSKSNKEKEGVNIQTLNIPESSSLLPKISFGLHQLDSLNVPNTDSQYVNLKQFETNLISNIKSLNVTKTQLVDESAKVYSEMGTFQTSFNSNRSDITRNKIRETTIKYLRTLTEISQISGENTYGTRIEELNTQLTQNDIDYVGFVQSERRKAAARRNGTNLAINNYFLLINGLVDKKNITRTQLNEYVVESKRLYEELDTSVQSEINTIELNKLPEEASTSSTLLTQHVQTVLTTRKSEKGTLDTEILNLKERDSIRTGKIKELKQISEGKYKVSLLDSSVEKIYVFYQKFLGYYNLIGDPEVIDKPDSELFVYMSTTVKTFMRSYEMIIIEKKKSITEELLSSKPDNLSESGLSKLIEIEQMFGEKFTILQQITTYKEKSGKSYLTILDIISELSGEILNKRDKLELKTTEADDGFNKTNVNSEAFINDYNNPKVDFNLEVMKSTSSDLTSSIRLAIGYFQEINKLNGTDTNNAKIKLLETRIIKIQEIVLREETHASQVLKFSIDTAQNLTNSRQREFNAYVSYWRNGIKEKSITTEDDPGGVSKKFEEKKRLVLEAFDSEIEIDFKNNDTKREEKSLFLSESLRLNTDLQSEIGKLILKESKRKQKHLEYQQFILSDVVHLKSTLFDVEMAKTIYAKGWAMFGNLTKSEIKGNNDETSAEELNNLKLAIGSRETSINAAVGVADVAKNSLLLATSKISVTSVGVAEQSIVTKTKVAIDESKALLSSYDTEIKKIEILYDKGAKIESVTEFIKVYNETFLKINELETTNSKRQTDIDAVVAKKEGEYSTLQNLIDRQSDSLISDGNSKFVVDTEKTLLTTYKRTVDDFRKLVVEKYSNDPNKIKEVMTPYDEKFAKTTILVNNRIESLMTYSANTKAKYDSTKLEIDGLLPTKSSWFFWTVVSEEGYDAAYFSGIDEKVRTAGVSLISLREISNLEIAIQSPNSERKQEIIASFFALEASLKDKEKTISAARDKFKLKELDEKEEKIQNVIGQVNQQIAPFGGETEYDSKIIKIGIDNSTRIVDDSLVKLSQVVDQNHKDVIGLKEKLGRIRVKIDNLKTIRSDLNLRLQTIESNILISQNTMSESDTDETFKTKSQVLMQLYDNKIQIQRDLNKIEPNKEKEASILSQTVLKQTLGSKLTSREQKKDALRILGQSQIIDGFSTTLQEQNRILTGYVGNSSEYGTVLSSLETLEQHVNTFSPANATQAENKATLQSEIGKAKITCGLEKVAFMDVESKLSSINNSLFVLPRSPAIMGYEEVRGFRVFLTSTYEAFTIRNNATKNKYTKETDVSKVDTKYSSLMASVAHREQTLYDAYLRLNSSSSLVNSMVETLNNENIQHHNISLLDDGYLFRVGIELDSLGQLLIDLQSSKSNLVSMLGPSEEIESRRILGINESVVTILTNLRGFFRTLNSNFESLKENKRTDDARNQRIETATSKFKQLYNIYFTMEPSQIILEGSQQTLDNLSNEITQLKKEKADAPLTDDLEKKYLEYFSVLEVHRNDIEAARSLLNSSKVAVENKLDEIEIEVNAENEAAYLESFDTKVLEIEGLLQKTQQYTNSLNGVMNKFDGPKENNGTYFLSVTQRLLEVKEKVSIIRETKEIERIELERKTKVDIWFQNATATINNLKETSPPAENLFVCNRLKSDIEAEYNKLDALNPTEEEKTRRDTQRMENLKPLNDKIGKLNLKKDRLDDEQQSLSYDLEDIVYFSPEDNDPRYGVFHPDLSVIKIKLTRYSENSNQLKKIIGEQEVLKDNNEETIRDVENLLIRYQEEQVTTLRKNVTKEQNTADKYIADLTGLSITKLDEVEGYSQNLINSQRSLDHLSVALDSYCSLSEKYFPDVSESMSRLKAETEEFITLNTVNIIKLQQEIPQVVTRLTEEKRVRDETIGTATTKTDTAISTAKDVFNAVSLLMENKDLVLTDLETQRLNANALYDSALESIRLEEATVAENTKDDETTKTTLLGVLTEKMNSLMTSKTNLDESISSNPNVLIIIQRDEISAASIEIANELNKLNPDNFNMSTDEDIIQKVNRLLYGFSLRVQVFEKMLDFGGINPFAGLGYRSQLEKISMEFRKRKETLNTNRGNTIAALKTYRETSTASEREHSKNIEVLKKRSNTTQDTIIQVERDFTSSRKTQLEFLKGALGVEVNFLNVNDKPYLANTEPVTTFIGKEEASINALEQETNNLVRIENVQKIKRTITTKTSETKDNLGSLAQTLRDVDIEYNKLKAFATDEDKPIFLAEQAIGRQKINEKIQALNTTIDELVIEAQTHKQKLDAFDNFVLENKDAKTDILSSARELLADARAYIQLNKEIEQKRANPIVADNSGVLTKLETLIKDCVAIKAEKERLDADAAREKARIRFESNTILGQANTTTNAAKQTAATFITSLDDLLLSNPETLGEDKFGEAMRLIEVATEAATSEIGLLDTHGVIVEESLESVTSKKGELRILKNVFETQQKYRVDNIKSAVESLKRTRKMEEKLKFESARSDSEQIKTDITQSSENTGNWYDRLKPESAGEYLFELNGKFRKQITDIRTKLNNPYKESYEKEYSMLNANPGLGDSVTYKAEVDAFVESTEDFLVKIETNMGIKETIYREAKEKRNRAEKLRITAATGQYLKDSLIIILDGLETKLNSTSGDDFVYTYLDSNIRMASDFIKGIRSFSMAHETKTEREKTYVFATEKEDKLFTMIKLTIAKKTEGIRELWTIELEQVGEIARREAELLNQKALDAARQVEIESEILHNLAIGAEEEVNRLRTEYDAFVAAASEKSEKERKDLERLTDEANQNSERLRLLLEEDAAANKLKIDLEQAKLNAILMATGYESESLINYIITLCLYIQNYAVTATVKQLDILSYFLEFQRNSLVGGIVAATVFDNALHLVSQLVNVNGGTLESLAFVLFLYFEYRIATLILYFVKLIINSVRSTPMKIRLPSGVPEVDSSVKPELSERLAKKKEIQPAEESDEKGDEEVPVKKSDEKGDEEVPSESEGVPDYGVSDGLLKGDDETQEEEAELIKPPQDKSKSVSKKKRVNVEDVCKNYDHLFEENYHLFVPPSTEMRGGMGPGTISGIGSRIGSSILPTMPDFSFMLKGFDLTGSPIGKSGFDPAVWGTESGYYEWKDENGDTVIELDDVLEPQTQPPNFKERVLNAVLDVSGRVLRTIDYFPEDPEAAAGRLKRLASQKRVSNYLAKERGKSLKTKLAGVARNRQNASLNAYIAAKAKIVGLTKEEDSIISNYEDKLDEETAEEKTEREARDAKSKIEQEEKNAYDVAVKQSKGTPRSLSPETELIISNYENKLAGETPEEKSDREARAVERAVTGKYEAAKAKRYSLGGTEVDQKIISDYEVRFNDTPKQRAQRNENEAQKDLEKVEENDQFISNYSAREKIQYWYDMFDGLNEFSKFPKLYFNPQIQIGQAEFGPHVNEKYSWIRLAKQKYYEEVTSKFLPSITTIKTENSLSGIDGLNLHVKDVITDGRCFSGAAFYLFKLNKHVSEKDRKKEKESQWVSSPITYDVNFSPAEKDTDSIELNDLIDEKIIQPIENKRKSDKETDLVEFVYNYHRGYVNDEVLDTIFESYDRNLLNSALSQLFLNEKIRGLLQKLNELEKSFKEYNNEGFSFTKLFKKAPTIEDYLTLRGSGNYLPEEISFNPHTNKPLLDLLHIEDGDVSRITFEVLNDELLEISNNIKAKPEFRNYYWPYINYIKSLKEVSRKSKTYPWTDPVVGPAQVLADVYQTNVVIKYELSYNQKNVVFNPRDPVTNQFIEADSTVYLLFKNMNGGSHYVALIDPAFIQEIRVDALPPPPNYTILELKEVEENVLLYENSYTYFQSSYDPSLFVKHLFKSVQKKPFTDDELYFRLFNMSEEEIEESKQQEIVEDGFRTIEGPRIAVIDGKGSIYDYVKSNYVTTSSTVTRLPPYKILEVKDSKLQLSTYNYVNTLGSPIEFTKEFFESTPVLPRQDNDLYFKLYNMSEEEIEISKGKKSEKLVTGFKSFEGPRKAVIDGKDSIYDYESLQFITTYLFDPVYNEEDYTIMYNKYAENPVKFKMYKPLRLDERTSIYDNKNRKYFTKSSVREPESVFAAVEELFKPPSSYTIFEINVGGNIVKDGYKGKIDETDGLFVMFEPDGETIVKNESSVIPKDFVEINPGGTVMKKNGIIIKNGTIGKVDDDTGLFGAIPPQTTRWSSYIFTPAVHRFIEVYPDNTYLKEGDIVVSGGLQQNTYDFIPDGPNKYKKVLRQTRRHVRPLVDDVVYFKLYNMSDDEIEESKKNKKNTDDIKRTEEPRKAIINGYDVIYDYDTYSYITTRPRVDDKQFFELFNTSNKVIKKQKIKNIKGMPTHMIKDTKNEQEIESVKGKRKAVINGKDAIFDYEKFEYITTAPTDPQFDKDDTSYDYLFNKYVRDEDKYKMYKPISLDGRDSILAFADEDKTKYMYITKTPKPVSGGGKRLHRDYDAMFQKEFEMEPTPQVEDYNELFEMEPTPQVEDYTELFETEPEPVMTDYTELFETEPEPVMTDYTDLFETEPEPVMTDYTDLFETEPEPEPAMVIVASVEGCTDLCEYDQLR